MATQKIFRYNSSKRHHKKTTFDMGYQNVFSSRFGELLPTTCKKVLAGDKWKLGVNTLTKVQAMKAPAFTRIKQNNFAFFVPCQVAWQYWNDFITNGTEAQGVIGSNAFNQDLDGVYKEPSVRLFSIMPYMKVAKGWAAPCYQLSAVAPEFCSQGRLQSWLCATLTSPLCPVTSGEYFPEMRSVVCYSSNEELPTDWKMTDTTLSESYLNPRYASDVFALYNKLAGGVLDWLYNEVAFIPIFGLKGSPRSYSTGSTQTSPTYMVQEVVLLDIIFWCSDTQLKSLCHRLFADFGFEVTRGSDPVVDISGKVNLSDFPSSVNSVSYTSLVSYTTFKNSLPYKDKVSPFIVEKTSFSWHHYNGWQSINYVPRLRYDYNVYDLSDTYVHSALGVDAGFFSFSLRSDIPYYLNRSDVAADMYSIFIDDFRFLLPPSAYGGSQSDEHVFEISDLTRVSYVAVPIFMFGGNYSDFFDYYDSSASVPDLMFARVYSSNSGFYIPNTVFGSRSHPSYPFVSVGGTSANLPCCGDLISLVFPYFCPYIAGGIFEEISIGQYDSLRHCSTFQAWIFYLLSNSWKLMQYLNMVTLDMLCGTYYDFAGFSLSLLPAMSYSLIWSEYMRNEMTSTPDPFYNHLNGCIYPLFFKYWEDLLITNSDYKIDVNVPSVDFMRLPSNGEQTESYFLLDNLSKIASVLFGIDYSVNFLQAFSSSGSKFENRFIVPNYYNAIFALRFQNFAKDYFSSAVFDPLSGANDVDVPDTISQLRNAERMASFWQRTAFTRSVRKFFGENFDVTPTHDQLCKPYLLGASHIDVNVGEVIQTSQTTQTSPQGQRSGLAAAHATRGLISNKFNEQGYIIVLTSHTLEQQYMQRLDKQVLAYNSFLDYPFPDFVGLGNQSINNHELYFQTSVSSPDYYPNLIDGSLSNHRGYYPSVAKHTLMERGYYNVSKSVPVTTFGVNNNHNIFGYTPRFTEYKFNFDECHGSFLEEFDFWQSFRKFYSAPTLCHEFVSWEFVVSDDDLKRLFADPTNSDYFFVDMFVNISVTRLLPLQSRPEGV